MKEIIVKTQEDLEAIKPDFDGYVYLEGGTEQKPLVLKAKFDKAYVISRGNAYLTLTGNAEVRVMRESSQVELYGEAYVSAYSADKIICHGYNVVRLLSEKKHIKTLKN